MLTQALSTTPVTTWSGTDLTTLGPIYPFVGTETILVVIGIALWLLFHIVQAGIERRELEANERAARDPKRLAKVFKDESTGH